MRRGRFYLPYLKKKPTVVGSLSHINELADSPELSQRAVCADIFGFKYTMAYEATTLEPNEQTAARYRLFSRAIKAVGLTQLPALQPHLARSMDRLVSRCIESQEDIDGWKTVKLVPFMREMATEPLALYFFGTKLCEEPEFAAAIRGFYKDAMRFMDALQFVPSLMAK
ncbi:MAG: cytochrome P450 [Lasallia pustulata]|uniref:Cytochrome P450 n=1 Tax=Lasallia pustulata TaxID=136370 RepID=A0A5M8PH37_9LECA|nr:MAG: cytochrome P450 [Lasallia pustulata]